MNGLLELKECREDENKRLRLIRLQLCDTCRVMDRCTCEPCYTKTIVLFKMINSEPLWFGEEGLEVRSA